MCKVYGIGYHCGDVYHIQASLCLGAFPCQYTGHLHTVRRRACKQTPILYLCIPRVCGKCIIEHNNRIRHQERETLSRQVDSLLEKLKDSSLDNGVWMQHLYDLKAARTEMATLAEEVMVQARMLPAQPLKVCEGGGLFPYRPRRRGSLLSVEILPADVVDNETGEGEEIVNEW